MALTCLLSVVVDEQLGACVAPSRGHLPSQWAGFRCWHGPWASLAVQIATALLRMLHELPTASRHRSLRPICRHGPRRAAHFNEPPGAGGARHGGSRGGGRGPRRVHPVPAAEAAAATRGRGGRAAGARHVTCAACCVCDIFPNHVVRSMIQSTRPAAHERPRQPRRSLQSEAAGRGLEPAGWATQCSVAACDGTCRRACWHLVGPARWSTGCHCPCTSRAVWLLFSSSPLCCPQALMAAWESSTQAACAPHP